MSDDEPFESNRLGRSRSDSVADYRSLSSGVWNSVCSYIRRNGIRPTLPLISKLAVRQANSLARERGLKVNNGMIEELGKAVAGEIVRRWDPRLARPPAAVPRPRRRQRRLEISALATSNGNASRRQLAAQMSKRGEKVSASTIQRALESEGLTRPWDKAALSDEARRIAAVIVGAVPLDGKRAVDLIELCEAADVDGAMSQKYLDEVSDARISIHIYRTQIQSFRRSTWLLISRGRKRSYAELLNWFNRAEQKRLEPHRLPLSPDQRVYAINLQRPGTGVEEADLLSVLAVAEGAHGVAVWRRFINLTASTVDEDGNPLPVDLEGIVTVVQSAGRRSNLADVLPKLAGWIPDPLTRHTAERVFLIAQQLITGVGHVGPIEAIRWWAATVEYVRRVGDGEVPGRSELRARELLASEEPDSWVLDASSDLPTFLRFELGPPADDGGSRHIRGDGDDIDQPYAQCDDHLEDWQDLDGFIYPPDED